MTATYTREILDPNFRCADSIQPMRSLIMGSKILSLGVMVLTATITFIGGSAYGVDVQNGDRFANSAEQPRVPRVSRVKSDNSDRTVRLSYTPDNRIKKILGPGNRRTMLDYDERGRLARMTTGRHEQEFEYNRLGFLKRIQDPTGTTDFETDPEGRITKMSYPSGDSISYEYSEIAAIKSVRWNKEFSLSYERDLFGNIVTMHTPAGKILIDYDYNKRFVQRRYPNGAFSQFTYNRAGRAVRIIHVASNGTRLLEFRYRYNDSGQLETAHEIKPEGELAIEYQYDAFGQLLRAKYSDGRKYTYQYDINGNRVKWSGPSGISTASYNAHDQLMSYNTRSAQHDVAGNLIKLGKIQYEFNDFDAMVGDGVATYQYNALGLRVESSSDNRKTRFLHILDDLPYVLAEQGSTTKKYLWADGHYLGQIKNNEEVLFYLEDNLGSIRGAINRQSDLVGEAEFKPFGVPIKRIPRVRFGFAGEEQDNQGNVFLRARYYVPEFGRFLSKDPELPDMMDEGKQNSYAYAGNSPTNYIDENGHEKVLLIDDETETRIKEIAEANGYSRKDLEAIMAEANISPYDLLSILNPAPKRTPSWPEVQDYLTFLMNETDFDLTRISQVVGREVDIWPLNWDVQKVHVPYFGELDINYFVTQIFNPKNSYGHVLNTLRVVSYVPYTAMKDFYPILDRERRTRGLSWSNILIPSRPSDILNVAFKKTFNQELPDMVGHQLGGMLRSIAITHRAVDGFEKAFESASLKFWLHESDLPRLTRTISPEFRSAYFTWVSTPKSQNKDYRNPFRKSLDVYTGGRKKVDVEKLKIQKATWLKYQRHKTGSSSTSTNTQAVKEIQKQIRKRRASDDDDDDAVGTSDQDAGFGDGGSVNGGDSKGGGPGCPPDCGPGGGGGPPGPPPPGPPGPGDFMFATDFFGRPGLPLYAGTPNVGGVYLDKAAEIMGDLSSIEAVTFDPVSNRLFLIGEDGEGSALSGLRLDHIAAAFRSVYGDYSTEPGVSIDPNSDNPLADEMDVKFFGGMENTHFGYFLFEADRMMKSLSLGEDNISHQKVKTSVPGYYNLLSLSFSNLAGAYNEDLWSRFWLVPERVIVNVSPDGKTIAFPDTRIRVKTETMRWDGGKLVPAVNEKDDKAEYFAAHFSKYYDKYAEEIPVFQELKKLANLVALAKWLRESGIPVDLAWLKNYETAFETPSTTPSYTVSDKRPMSNNAIRKISIFGGTDLSVEPVFKKDASAAEYGSKVLKEVSAGPEVASKLFIDTNQEKKRVVALPTSQTRAPGSKYLRELELEYLPRVFSSFHNGTGPFGYSWAFDIPHLDIGLPQRGKTEYVELKGQRVIVRTFRLARPFGLQDVKFRKHTVDQQHGRIVFLPGKQEGIRGLYPDEETNQFRVEYNDGMSETYDAEGRLIRRDYNSTSYLEFSYDQDRKIKDFKAVFGEQAQTWSLSYDSRGRVASAKGPEESWNYGYDEDNNLVQVTNGTFSREYRYDEKHLVTQVLTNSQVISTINYDKLGRVKSEKIADGRIFEPKIDSRDATFIVRDGNGKNQAVEVFDPAGRILDVRNPSGAKISWNYDKSGNVESIVRTNRFGEANTYEYSSDARLIKHTNPEQDIRAFLFDEFGRLKQVQNGTSALLNKTYISTNQGWLEETETLESKIQVFFDNSPKKATNKNERVREVNIVSKNTRGGQIIETAVYANKGEIQKISTKGSIKTNKLFEDGRVAELRSANEKITYSYNAYGKVRQMKSTDRTAVFSYDDESLISKFRFESGNFQQIHKFDEGRIRNRTNNLGLDDQFQYREDGTLRSVTREDGDNWSIDRDKKLIRATRNGVEQFRLNTDKRGRLIELTY